MSVKRALIVCTILAMLIALGAVIVEMTYILRSSARKAWKQTAITTIRTHLAEPTWESREIAMLANVVTNGPFDSERWCSERLILMKNGDWIAYTNVCRKENWRIDDLFIGRGSDGQWYYSTYHFCKDMIVLRM